MLQFEPDDEAVCFLQLDWCNAMHKPEALYLELLRIEAKARYVGVQMSCLRTPAHHEAAFLLAEADVRETFAKLCEQCCVAVVSTEEGLFRRI